jgi:hypothetical protein
MNATKKLICILTAGAALGAAAPVFADSEHDRGHDHDRGRYSYYDRHDHRNYNRDFNRRQVIVVQRPYIVAQPVYYPEPAPAANLGVGALLGAAIGGYIDSRQ